MDLRTIKALLFTNSTHIYRKPTNNIKEKNCDEKLSFFCRFIDEHNAVWCYAFNKKKYFILF